MTLRELINACFDASPAGSSDRTVKVVVVGPDGQLLHSLGIARIELVQEWTDMPDGGRQYRHKVSIVTEPIATSGG